MSTEHPPAPVSSTKDRKASKGDEYAHETNASGEGNDPSLTHGKTIIREVPGKRSPTDPAGGASE